MRQRIQARLPQISHPGHTDHQAVHLPKRREAKHLGAVVRYSGVVQRPIQDEQHDIRARGPHRGHQSQAPDERRGRDEEDQDEEGRGVVQDGADEGDGEDAAEGEGEVEEGVDLRRQGVRV